MVEILGVLAIIMVLSVLGIKGYFLGMQKYRTNNALETIAFIVQETRAMFGKAGHYDGLGTWGSNGWGDDSSVAEQIINNFASNSIYSIGLSQSPSENVFAGAGFFVAIQGLPQDICVDLHTKDWSGYDDDYYGLTPLDDDIPKASYSPSEALEYCSDEVLSNGTAEFRIYFNAFKK